ncbi:MAG: hypothetical protein JO006_09220 [Paucibacter sp.]|nr:hypothetical protein [Roseateles sp.]
MINIVIGVSNLLIGAAYVSLGLLSAWEAVSQYRYRGLSRFGLGFSLMAASCGPHHLVHGWCVLHGGAVSAPMLAVALMGLPAGVVFCWLRVEAMMGGRGDRTIAVTSHVVAGLLIGTSIAVGSLAAWAIAAPAPFYPDQAICTVFGIRYAITGPQAAVDYSRVISLANLWVTAAYAMVGWYLIETQIRRYIGNRSWSLSGLSLSAVFPSCAAMHLILALSSGGGGATLPFDLLGVPASIYFLWVVRRLHRESVVDWNHRPMAGVLAMPHRSSPWSE